MALLAEAQVEILKWIAESESGQVVHAPVGNAAEDVLSVEGEKRSVNPGDFRELVDQGLLRHVDRQMYEVTNPGRLEYQQRMAPPPEDRPPVGFQPPE